MDYTRSIRVVGGHDEVAALFADASTWHEWQPPLLAVDVLDGAPPATGARSRLTFRRGRRGTMVMTETVEHSALPEQWNVVYEVPGVYNLCENRFTPTDAGSTIIEQRNVFRFTGFMRVVGLLFGRSFPRETEKSLEAFRAFATERFGAAR
ncbi:SRPBCC family protein [Microcella humidisoli]|uniref:SRPBCC family protein n=1 Tax=Microcella humidisoli TaxID=2963406 RepID=A0ABY5FZF4_9MICO|nr:SRPBCC family protein [Microcella humidisoli]UTT63658.1 SRPBCC family protein [Microcella humidisoli]